MAANIKGAIWEVFVQEGIYVESTELATYT